jgi:anthrone oxygenase-like protein
VAAMDPLNRLADSWVPDRLPHSWSEVRHRWAALHLVRTFVAVAAFVCLTLTQVIDR